MEEMKKEPAANSEYVLEVKNLVKWFPPHHLMVAQTSKNNENNQSQIYVVNCFQIIRRCLKLVFFVKIDVF